MNPGSGAGRPPVGFDPRLARTAAVPASIQGAMQPTSDLLRRSLAVLLTVTPLLASADLCMVGALTGRADLMCGMERTATACHAEAAPPPCARCVSTEPAPAPEPAPSQGPTCCDLRPQAEGSGGQPALFPPLPIAHPAAASVVVAPVVVASAFGIASGADRAPPADLPPPLSPRAPPLG